MNKLTHPPSALVRGAEGGMDDAVSIGFSEFFTAVALYEPFDCAGIAAEGILAKVLFRATSALGSPDRGIRPNLQEGSF